MSKLNNLTTVISANKRAIGHRALLLGGTLAGAIIADGLLNPNKPTETHMSTTEEKDDGEVITTTTTEVTVTE